MQMAAAVSTQRSARTSAVKGQSKKASERLIEVLLIASGLISVLTTAGILYVLAFETVQFFSDVSLTEFLTGLEWTPLFADAKFGLWPLLSGTLLTSGIALATAIPFGMLAAIYL